MGRGAILGCMEKREILNKVGVSREDLVSWGDRFWEEGALSDALDFYAKADATGGDSSAGARAALEKIASLAIEEGDLFLLTKVSRALGQEPEADTLKLLAENAAKLGKEIYAAQARTRAGEDVPPEEQPVPT